MKFYFISRSNMNEIIHPENFDELFDLASKDVTYRPLFYRTILEMELFLLVDPESNLTSGVLISDNNTKLQVKVWEDGKVPVFTSIDKIFDNGIIRGKESYVAINGKVIFAMFNNPTTFLLNPYSRPSKEFLPDEIIRLLTGELY